MQPPQDIIALSAPVAIEAGEKRLPRFEAVFYTGGALDIDGYDQPVVIDLAGLQPGNLLVANLDHDHTKRVGNFELENDGRKLVARGVASAATPARDEVIQSAKAGYRWQASLEVRPQQIETVKAGTNATVNGRNFAGPAYVTRRGILKGFAFVSHGADDDTSVSIAARHTGKSSMATELQFQEWVQSIADVAEDLTGEQLAGLYANFHGRSDVRASDREAVLPFIAASADPVEAEERRLRQIDGACRGDNWGDYSDKVNELKAQALGGELGIDSLIQEVRQIRREKMHDTMPVAHAPSASRRDQNNTVIEAAFCLAGGLAEPEKHFSEQVLDQASQIQRNASIQGLLLQSACAAGYQACHGERLTNANLPKVLQAAFSGGIRASGGYSTISVANVLANTANKFLLQGFQEVGDEWRTISEVKPVNNFLEHSFVRLLDNLPFEQIAPAGTLKHGTLGDERLTGNADTYGTILQITRTDIINDNLSAFQDVPRRLGRAAGNKLRRLFWTAFLASDSFFDAGNNNLDTTSGALEDDGTALAGALKTIRAQRSPDEDGGKILGFNPPGVMLVHPNDEVVARRLINSTAVTSGGGSTATTVGNANPFAGLATLVVADFLNDASVGGSDNNHWYLFRSPSFLPAMLVLALNGNVNPTVETAEADFNTLGVAMRGFSDVGVARGEKLAGIKVEVSGG